MRKVDAPGAGWYPDPQHRARLRWWDGLDWTDIKRSPPSSAELEASEELARFMKQNELVASAPPPGARPPGGWNRQDAEELISEVRSAARQEVERAAQQFSDRATTAVRGISPLISEYTSQVTKWIRRAIIIAIILLVAYFVFQVIAQASFFEWLGDRIDNLTDESSRAP